MSLVLSLMAASIAILVKQWLHEYTDLTSSQVEEHVHIRQYRFGGYRRWRVSTIMKLLPLLLQISLLLFFIGLAVLLWTVSIPVTTFVMAPTVVWLIFWLSTIALPSVYGDCPYKSAESAIFFALVQQMKSSAHSVLQLLSKWLSPLESPYLFEWSIHYLFYYELGSPPSRFKKVFWTLLAKFKRLIQTLLKKTKQRYDNWRKREKELVKKNVPASAQQVMRDANDILMDERVHSIAICLSGQALGTNHHLLALFAQAVGCSEETLNRHHFQSPDWQDSKWARPLIVATVDAFRNSHISFRDGLRTSGEEVSSRISCS